MCMDCPRGTYLSTSMASALSQCRGCPPGRYSQTLGMTTVSGCLKCPDGKSSTLGATACTGCPPGTFPDKIVGGCVACPMYSIATENATSASACICPAGFFKAYNAKASGGEMTYSEDAQGRKYMNHVFPTGKGELIVVKPVILTMMCAGQPSWGSMTYEPDTYPVNIVDITCALPFTIKYQVDTELDLTKTSTYFECSPCEQGAFSAEAGADQCNMCMPGTYQDQPGSTNCKTCAPGTISGDNMPQCDACPTNSYQDENDCQACPTGAFTLGPASTACVSCPPNTWSDAESNGCKQCPPWSLSSAGSGSMGCICYEGLYLFKDGGNLACMQCPVGKFSSGSSNICSLCPAGTYGDRPALGACTPCPTGQFALPGSTTCAQCVLPQIPTNDGGACQDCPKGMVCQQDGQVEVCPPGTYGAGTGYTSLDQCMQCPPNQVCTDPATAEQCPPNTHSVPGSTSMLQCECDFGFDCTYTKSIKGKVVLPLEPEQFDDDMRAAFIQAIAESAGVTPDRVRIVSIERVTNPSTRAFYGHGRRPTRPAKPTTQILVRVIGAASLRGVDRMFQRHGLPKSVIRLRVSRDHHVDVRRRLVSQGGWI